MSNELYLAHVAHGALTLLLCFLFVGTLELRTTKREVAAILLLWLIANLDMMRG